MQHTAPLEVPVSKRARYVTDFSMCIICQKAGGALVGKPSTYEKVLQFVHERAKYGDGEYPEVSRRLGDLTDQDLGSINATWHRKCYQNTVHVQLTKRAREKFEKMAARGSRAPDSFSSDSSSTFTRSQSVPFEKDACFFCEQGALYNNKPVHKVVTGNAGQALKHAVEKSRNEKFRVKLSTAINPEDVHAIDIRYHKHYRAIHVTHVLRRSEETTSQHSAFNDYAAEVEFLSLVQGELLDGHIISMATLQDAYIKIRTENNVMNPMFSRKMLKKLLQREIMEIEFHRPKRVNESERVSIKCGRDATIHLAEDDTEEGDVDMKCLFTAASILRKAISKARPWTFAGSLSDVEKENIPTQLYSFYCWIIQGPKTSLSTESKSTAVNRNAMSLAQSTMSMFLSKHQVNRKETQSLRAVREMPQQLAIGLAIRQAIRSKKVINILHGLGVSVEYNRLLRIESQIANSVLHTMLENDMVYLPPDVIKGRFIFFAIDNVDFAEDTADGKHTLHATAMASYQRCQPGDEARKLKLLQSTTHRSMSEFPDTPLLQCSKPLSQTSSPTYPTFTLAEDQVQETCSPDAAWLMGRIIVGFQSRLTEITDNQPDDSSNSEENGSHDNIPSWSGYNSLVSKQLPVTRVGAPPLVPAPAHEWTTLLTILKQAQHINAKVVGPDRKTVISLDMGLYKPAKQLQMARDDMDHLVLRTGELHFVMAQLRTLGAYIENSGLDFCWTEADMYGPATVKQILEGRHVRRGVEAHLLTLQALSIMYHEAFFEQHPDMVEGLTRAAQNLRQACHDDNDIQQAHDNMITEMQSLNVLEKMSEFDKQNDKLPLFIVMRQYMKMVMEMLQYLRSVRTGDWNLHLASSTSFVKYFFAHSMLNYARMMPVYLADMESLKQTDADIYDEFLKGNWVVNKNPHIPFCAIGADHALEHVNRSMKVSGGLIGITLNPSARTKFFLIAPELARLAGEAEDMAGYASNTKLSHHTTSALAERRQSMIITALAQTIKRFTNPFTEDSEDLYNLVTKAIMPEKVTLDLCTQSQIGSKLLDEFVSNRIKTNKINIWAPMKKCKLQTWKSTGKQVKLKVNEKLVELKEDRNLFARLLIVAKSRPNINLEKAVGKHELSVVPRSMFAADGQMLHCSAKSNLMSIIVSLLQESNVETEAGDLDLAREGTYRVALIDGMAEVQALSKPDHIKSCSDLGDHFFSHIQAKYSSMDEIRIIFDRYDVQHSLKMTTRSRRQGTQVPVAYHITDTTNIAKVSMKKLLSHQQTKMELTGYLGEKILEHASANKDRVVVAWGTQCRATFTDKSYISSDQEEADTKLILHAADATTCGATRIDICSPDTDVFILAIRRYPDLCKNTNFVTGPRKNCRTIKLGQIYNVLGPSRAAALPGLHALSGSDNTGSFIGKGKQSFWKAFEAASDATVSALACLGTTTGLSDNTYSAIEEFICKVYVQQTPISKVEQLRWWMFKKKQAESEKLPPTPAALHQAILRCHHQSIVWNQDTVACPDIPSPEDYGWKHNEGGWTPVMTTELPAPQSVLHLVKCGCKTQCHSGRCSCQKAGLYCTDLCSCTDEEQPCENIGDDDDDEEDEEAEEESDEDQF